MKTLKSIIGKKYRDIVISIALFLLLDSSVLLLSFYVTSQLDSDAHAISIITRQRALAEEMLRGLYSTYVDTQSPTAPYIKTIDTLADPFKQFDETLDSMIYGGELIGSGQGSDKLFNRASYMELNRPTLDKIDGIWKQYRALLSPIANAYFNDYSRQDVLERSEKAIVFAKNNHKALSNLLEQMSINIESTARAKVQIIRKVQSVGIILAIANFIFILFHFIRKLNRSDEAAENAEHETREILNSVSDGLFLIDRSLNIGDQHSASLAAILPADSFSHRNFRDVMRPYVTEKTLSTAVEYIELLFTEHVEETLIHDLNPLNEVSIHVARKEGSYNDVRHLQFSFRRTWDRQKMHHVLVAVSDVTEAVQLREALQKSEKKAEADMLMLTAILHLEPQVLSDFLNSSRDTLEQINHVFRQPGRHAQALTEKLHKTQRLAHKLKGDCSLTDLRFLAESVHRFETRLKALQEKDSLSGDDFVGAAVALDHLMRDISTVQSLTARIEKFSGGQNSNNPGGEAASTSSDTSWQNQLRNMAKTIARDEDKFAQIQWSGHQTEDMPAPLRAAIQDVIVQCTRNAICHGIETATERLALGKPQTGTVQVSLIRHKDHVALNIRDDGSGIDLKRIKERAVENSLMSSEAAGQLDTAKLLTMIFHPNFSTARHNSLHAGRGVGLSLVREILQSSRASVSLKNRAGSFTEFSFRFPLQNTALKTA